MKHIISLGAGVQSSTMALMAAAGEITPMPDAAIFADTQDEPDEVYKRLLDGDNAARMPFFIKGAGLAKRQCTREFKIRPIRQKVRDILGVGRRDYVKPHSVTQWIGISTDEADRQKPSGVKFIDNRWPLLEDGVLMSRKQCAAWLLRKFGVVAPKSACKQCPYQPVERLLHLKETDAKGWSELVAFDEALRSPEQVKRFRGELFVSQHRQPLVQVDLVGLVANKKWNELQKGKQLDMWTQECEGMCGV